MFPNEFQYVEQLNSAIENNLINDTVILSSPVLNENNIKQEDTKDGNVFGHMTPFVELEPEETELSRVVASLTQSDDYTTLLFSAWRQPSYGVKNPKRVYLTQTESRLRDDYSTESQDVGKLVVEGLLAIKVSKLLHVELDFLYYHHGTPVRLKERRKVRLRETHYFDHPLFSLIVRVLPYEEEAEDL